MGKAGLLSVNRVIVVGVCEMGNLKARLGVMSMSLDGKSRAAFSEPSDCGWGVWNGEFKSPAGRYEHVTGWEKPGCFQ
jgi:hypothetical protein